MLIDIGIADWEQHCCGERHVIGESSTFAIFHAPGFESGRPGRSAFYATWHDTAPASSAIPVTGEVVSIRAVYYKSMPHPVHPGVTTEDPSTRTEVELGRLLSRLDATGLGENAEDEADAWWNTSEFVVTLDVPDGTHLPSASLHP